MVSQVISDSLFALAQVSDLKVWIRSKDFKQFLYISPSFLSLWPNKEKSHLEKPNQWLCYLTPESAESLTDQVNTLAETQQSENGVEIHYTIKHSRQDISIVEKVFPVFEDGVLVRYIGTAQRKEQTHNNIQIGDVLQKLAEKSRDVFWIRNDDYSKQIFVSPSFEEVWGRDKNILIEHPEKWSDFLHPEDRIRLESSISQRTPHIEADTTFLMEYRCIQPNGDVRWIRDESFPIYDDEKNHIGFAGIAQDISKEKELEYAKEMAKIASKSKSEFLANMSHDLRTPLNWLLGAAELLLKRNNDPNQHKLFEMIVDGGKRIQHMVEEILDYAKLESGRLPIYKEPLNLRHCIEEVVQLIASEANQKKLAIIVDYPDSVERHVIGDMQRLRRIILNLVSNALKFTQDGFIQIKIRANTSTEYHSQLSLHVIDTGIGIPKEKQETIFDRFEKVEASYHSPYKGVGLGLAIVKKFVEGMNGEVSVKSELKKGSEFIAQLPFAKPSFILKSESKWHRHCHACHVLIIDVLEERARTYNHILGNTHLTSTPSQAIELLQTDALRAINIILIDDGIEDESLNVIGALLEAYPFNSEPMIVNCRTPDLNNNTPNLHDINIFNTFLKPITPTELQTNLHNCWVKWLSRTEDKLSLTKSYQPKILLVEDEPFGQKIVSMLLEEELGCSVSIAEDSPTAMKILQNESFDLILMDIGLPGKDGLTITEEIRQLENCDQEIPIVALTAHASDKIVLQCKDVGMQNHLAKPTSTEDLLEIIVEHILYLN